jgi:hypothetical protein
MDFVEYLIQEGYGEEEIGDILECLYIIEDIDSENLTEEVLLEKNLKLAAIEASIKALKRMPMNSWVKKQLAKLRLARQKATKVAADKADDVAAKAGDGVTSTRQGSATYRPGSTKTPTPKGKGGGKNGRKGGALKNTRAAALGGGAMSLWNKIPGWVKGAGAVATGVAAGTILGRTNPPPSSPTQTPGDTKTPEEPKTPSPEDTAKEAERKRRSQRAYGWWKNIQPRRGYAAEPGLSAYRNVRQNINAGDLLLGYLISEGHAETVEEAIYVANQLDEDFIREIINEEI